MCNARIITFAVLNLSKKEIEHKRILEVGSLDVIGSVRPVIERLNPKEYIGIDIEHGKGVDIVCDAQDLAHIFGENSFDVVVCTEVLEHIKDWRKAISNIKRVCRHHGIIFLTTKMPKFVYHAYPDDYWRFSERDFCEIFGDCQIKLLETYPNHSILIKAVKPNPFIENDLSELQVYRMPFTDKLKYVFKMFLKRWL